MYKSKRILLFVLGFSTLAILFACAEDYERENPWDPKGIYGGGASSPSEEQSSSSALKECEGTFNPANKFCYDGMFYDRCDGMEYIPTSQICEDDVAIPAKCNDTPYNPLEKGCCDSKMFDLVNHRCESSVIETKCGSGWYNHLTHFCDTDGKTYSCGDKPYNPATHFCDIREEGKAYKWVKIDKQTWMAENLNYDVDGSVCYERNPANCNKYGMLYDWATAMALDASCNTSTCSGQVNVKKHQGICPSGWHIPGEADWNALMKFANPSCSDDEEYCAGAGTKLKAKSGWNAHATYGNGTDDFGFSALPGGYGGSGGTFENAGKYGDWWSTEGYDNGSNVYGRRMYYNSESAQRGNFDKSSLRSVRCVKD
jgi:uncharacterized protein (TIGR02145 family)